MTSVIFKIFLYKKAFCDSFHRLESSDLTLLVRFIQTVVFLVNSTTPAVDIQGPHHCPLKLTLLTVNKGPLMSPQRLDPH